MADWDNQAARCGVADSTDEYREHGRVDILVLDFWGDDQPVPFGTPFWSIPRAMAGGDDQGGRCGRT